MIVLDTHVWVWWVHASDHLTPANQQTLDAAIPDGLGISIISCWEVAKLVEFGRLRLPCDIEEWLAVSLA